MVKLTLFYTALIISLSTAVPLSSSPNLSIRQTSETENDLLDGSPCKALTLIFARGTTELGNMGAVVGPPFAASLVADIGDANVAVQGVDYPATIPEFLEGGDPTGSATMASLVALAISQCPETKIVISGYSQGAQLVHNAAAELTSSETAKVGAVVVFGDPDNGKPVGSIPASKVLTFCAVGDDICLGGDLVLPAHLSYGANTPAAASFAVGKTGL